MAIDTIQESHRGAMLAIVIPTYKATFLEETLASIAVQTSQAFTLYIGDDASPEDIAGICQRWAHRLPLRYHRFESNLGGRDLVGQWERCIALTSEPWLWLFGDDDIMDAGCIEALLQRIQQDQGCFDVYHFNVRQIDSFGKVVRDLPKFPEVLSGFEFVSRKLSGELEAFAPDFVFSRAAWFREAGFQNFPLAWCSDDATWLKFSGVAGIRTVGGPCVYWRKSGLNISSYSASTQRIKLRAVVEYINWLRQRFHKQDYPSSSSSWERIESAALSMLYSETRPLAKHQRLHFFYESMLKLRGMRWEWFYTLLRYAWWDLNSRCRR